MDAVKYVLAKEEMCEAHACSECPIAECCEPSGLTEVGLMEHVKRIEEWAEKHDEKKRAEIIEHITRLRDIGAECFSERREDGDKFVVVVDCPKGGDDGKA